MKRISQAVLLIIAFALVARTAVSSFCPGLGKFSVSVTAPPSDWSEEPVEEDESGEEDTALTEINIWVASHQETAVPLPHDSFSLLEHELEIVVPPPQS